ncbi:MAG: nucleotide-binding protein [Solidesulfovibrio sp.]|uniref:nucleotide-binding protein n=1 Tax=Solidesulfovibrio sp. TaxID=2910990 RepID=UPI003158D0B9
MYYHVLIEKTEKVEKDGEYRQCSEFDETDLNQIEARIIRPYLLKEEIHFDGYFLAYTDIKRILIKETQRPIEDLLALERSQDTTGLAAFIRREYVFFNEKYTTDITTSVIGKVKASLPKTHQQAEDLRPMNPTEVFIVHGRDELAKTQTARFVENLGFSAIILNEQPNLGKTLIEKIEEYTNVGFAIVLYTPCDIGGLSGVKQKKPRARQNVVFEHGYLISKLGRQKVCALVKGKTEFPSDLNGIAYYTFDEGGAWKSLVAGELYKAGYTVDLKRFLKIQS